MNAYPLSELKLYDYRLWEKGVAIVTGFGGTVLAAYEDWLAAAALWTVFAAVALVGEVRSRRVERRAVGHVRSRARSLTAAQRATELAMIEHYTHGDFGSLSPRVRRLKTELEALAGGLDSAVLERERQAFTR